jgi:hypothetical protein
MLINIFHERDGHVASAACADMQVENAEQGAWRRIDVLLGQMSLIILVTELDKINVTGEDRLRRVPGDNGEPYSKPQSRTRLTCFIFCLQ